MKVYQPTPIERGLPVIKDASGMPLPPKGIRLAKSGALSPGAIPVNMAYSAARREWLGRQLAKGASCDTLADKLTRSGVRISGTTVAQIGYALRRDGALSADWTPHSFPQAPALVETPALKSPSEPLERSEANSVQPVEMSHGLPSALNGKFADLVTDALVRAREGGAQEADALAADWIEKIARGRAEAEVRHVRKLYERKYDGVLDVLTR